MKSFLLLLFWLPPTCLLLSQQPDFEVDFFYPLPDQPPPRVTASALLYSDGDNLACYIEVKDADIQIRREDRLTDQVRIWLALPQTAYPEDFEYRFHPSYICSNPNGRGVEGPRMFSLHGDAGGGLKLGPFVQDYDYPQRNPYSRLERVDSVWVPPVNQLSEKDIHFGLIELAFFPDGRPPRLLNGQQLKLVENSLGFEIGNLNEGILYQASRTEANDGYTLDVQLSPQSLGFVQLPYMKRIRILIEVVDASYPGALPKPVLTSKAYGSPPHPSTFDLVSFNRPIRTNFLDIPEDFLFATQYFPVIAYSRVGWLPTVVDVDPLMYRPRELSHFLTEVKIARPEIAYINHRFQGRKVERMAVTEPFVNKKQQVREFTRIDNQLFERTRTRLGDDDPALPDSGLFVFPDKALGLILKNSRYLDPYGWDEAPDAQEETIDFYRLEDGKHRSILSIQQQDGPQAFCRIGDQLYQGFYLLFMQWIDKGKRMVFYLNHHETKEARRVVAHWDRHGERLEIKEIE